MPFGEQTLPKRKLHRRSLQDQSVAETPLEFKSVPYENARTSVPPKAQTQPLHGNRPLQFQPGSEQDALVRDAAKKVQHDRYRQPSPPKHSLPPYQLPIRGSSNKWSLAEESKDDITKPPEQGNRNSGSGITDLGIERKPYHQSDVGPTDPSTIDPYVKDRIQYSTSETVDVDKRIARPAIHETIRPHVRHIRHEHITREIHTHEIYPRILPLIEIEVLPAKHFFRAATGELVPISEEEKDKLAIEYGGVSSYTISATTTTRPPAEAFAALKQFTARPIRPHERKIESWVDEDGVERSTQYHFHRPVLLGASLGDDMDHALQEIPMHGPTKVTRTVNDGMPDGVPPA